MGLLHQRGSTQCGSEVPSFPRCPLSKKCGFRRMSMMIPVRELFIENASKLRVGDEFTFLCCWSVERSPSCFVYGMAVFVSMIEHSMESVWINSSCVLTRRPNQFTFMVSLMF